MQLQAKLLPLGEEVLETKRGRIEWRMGSSNGGVSSVNSIIMIAWRCEYRNLTNMINAPTTTNAVLPPPTMIQGPVSLWVTVIVRRSNMQFWAFPLFIDQPFRTVTTTSNWPGLSVSLGDTSATYSFEPLVLHTQSECTARHHMHGQEGCRPDRGRHHCTGRMCSPKSNLVSTRVNRMGKPSTSNAAR